MIEEDVVDESEQELRDVLPFIKSWRQLYLVVIGELILLILLFYLFSNSFG